MIAPDTPFTAGPIHDPPSLTAASPDGGDGVSNSRRPRRRVLLAQAWWQVRVFHGVARYAAEHDWELHAKMHWSHAVPTDWQGDGIIAYAGVSRWMQRTSVELVNYIRSRRVPVVDLQAFGDTFGAPRVALSHEAIGAIGARHYLSLGHRFFGYVSFDDNPLEAATARGFREAAERAGGCFHLLTPATLQQSIRTLPKPLALLTMNDPNALRVIELCRNAGYHVPEHFAVLGVDDTPGVCDLAAVPLSSIESGLEQQGYEAARILDRMMNGDATVPLRTTILPRGVIARQSTDLPALADFDVARVLRAVRTRFRERLNVQQIVDELQVPMRRVHGRFRASVGRTILQELTHVRIEHAKMLLAGRRMKLDAIAAESGFASRFHFLKAFRRTTGLTPKQYRLHGATPAQQVVHPAA